MLGSSEISSKFVSYGEMFSVWSMHAYHSYNLHTRISQLRHIRVLLIVICITIHLLGNSQEPVLKFTNISTEQGQSENTVLDIIQDPYGYMWFATENGLTKFDGMNYTVFRNDDLDTTSIANDEIQSLCIKGDELFIASVYPTIVSAFNLKTEKFRVILRCDRIDDLEKAYFLKNDNYTLLITYWEKFIYNDLTEQFEVYDGLNEALRGIGSITHPELETHVQLSIQAEHYYLDQNDKLVAFNPDIGLVEISLPELSHKILFNYEESQELYNFEIMEELPEVFVFRDSEKRIWFNINGNQLRLATSTTPYSRSLTLFILYKDFPYLQEDITLAMDAYSIKLHQDYCRSKP